MRPQFSVLPWPAQLTAFFASITLGATALLLVGMLAGQWNLVRSIAIVTLPHSSVATCLSLCAALLPRAWLHTSPKQSANLVRGLRLHALRVALFTGSAFVLAALSLAFDRDAPAW